MHFSFVTKFTILSQSDHPLLPQCRGGPHEYDRILLIFSVKNVELHEVPLDAMGGGGGQIGLKL